MASATPAASRSPDGPTPASSDPPQNASVVDRTILDYLRSRGYHSAEQSLVQDLVTSSDDRGKQAGVSISAEEFVKKLAVFLENNSGENALRDSTSVLRNLSTMSNPTNIQNLLATIGAVGTEEILSLDPTDKQEGFQELEAWVDGSLDMYMVRENS